MVERLALDQDVGGSNPSVPEDIAPSSNGRTKVFEACNQSSILWGAAKRKDREK